MSQDRVAISGNQKSRIGHYELLDTIGKGSYAKVRRGRHIPTGTEVAVKVVRWHTSSRLRKLQQREVDCMKALDHPNIVKLFEVIDTRESLFLVMEYLSGGDLFSYLEGHGPMTEDEARGPFRQLVSAVQYCHQKGIVHRDLKPENVLFDAQRTVRLADFGLSAQFDDSKLRTLCGTLPYAAPELFLGLGYYGPPVDVWSLGVLLYNMLTGTLPFQGEEFWRLRQQILSGHYEQPAGVSLGGQVLLKKLMNLEPTERGSLTEVMPDPWLNQGQEEGLRPYSEPPCEDMDPGVMRRMTELGFEWERIQDSVKTRKYNSVMATYVMLCAAKHEVKCRSILVRPFHSRHPSSDSSGPSSALEAGPGSSGLCRELQESGQQAEEPTRPPASPVASSATPAPGPESGTATPSPAPPRGPGDSPPTDGTSPSSPGGGNGGGGGAGDSGGDSGGSGGDSSSGGGGNGGTPDTASRRRPGLARRFLNFILSKLCCRPFRARRGKRNRVAPL